MAVRRCIGAMMVIGTLLDCEEFPPPGGCHGTSLRHLKRQPASTAYQGVTHIHTSSFFPSRSLSC